MLKLIDILYWFMFFGTLATIAFAWGIFLASLNRPSPDEKEYEQFENRMLELMGQFRHISATRMQMLDKKIEEMRKLIQQANDLYAALCSQEAVVLEKTMVKEDEKISTKEQLQIETNHGLGHQSSGNALEVQNEKTQQDSLERKILLLYQEGKSESQIAKELGVGIGEVMLILSLFRFRTDLH